VVGLSEERFRKIVRPLGGVFAQGSFRDCFLVTSAGSAATRWVASSLNMHPEITCSGGAGELSDTMDYDKRSTPEQTERIAEFLITHFATPGGPPKTLRQTFRELRAFKPAGMYGSVHLFTLTSLLHHHENVEKWPVQFPLANIVRHPIGRLETHFAVSMRNFNTGPNCRRLLELCWAGYDHRFAKIKEQMAARCPDLESDVNKRIFSYSLFDTLATCLGDFVLKHPFQVRHYLMEDLKVDSVVFAEFVRYITRGKILVDEKYLATIHSTENMERGRFTGRSLKSEREYWESWTQWQRDFFNMANGDQTLSNFYGPLGYDFSYVK